MVVDRASNRTRTAGRRERVGWRRIKHRVGRSLAAWRDSEHGASAVEFAFVAPVLLMVLTGILQFGAIFFLQGNMANAAREAARALAVGSIETATEAETLVGQNLVNWGVTFSVNTTIPVAPDTDYTVVVTAPLSEAAIFDYLGVLEGGTLRASASMRGET